MKPPFIDQDLLAEIEVAFDVDGAGGLSAAAVFRKDAEKVVQKVVSCVDRGLMGCAFAWHGFN